MQGSFNQKVSIPAEKYETRPSRFAEKAHDDLSSFINLVSNNTDNGTMIRENQEGKEQQDENCSQEETENVHQGGRRRAPNSDTSEALPFHQISHQAASAGAADSDDNSSSPEDDGDHDGEDDKMSINRNFPTHLSLDASPGGAGDRFANFPLKLHKMLERAETEGFQTTVSWVHPPSLDRPTVSGTGDEGQSIDNKDGHLGYTPFKVHNPEKFVQDVIPRFFQMTKFKSFLRQLNIWGFSRDRSKGPLSGSYYHRDFVRQDPELCQKMKRTKNKGMYKRGSKGSSSSPATKARTRIGPIPVISHLAKDGFMASNSEDAKREGSSSISSNSYTANEVGTARPDVSSIMMNQDILRARNSASFPSVYRPMLRGLEKEHEQQFYGSDMEVRSPSCQIMEGTSQHQQQRFVRGGLGEAPVSSQFSLGEAVWRATTSVMHQELSVDQQNVLLLPPPSRDLGQIQRGTTPTYYTAGGGMTTSTLSHNPNSHRTQGERQGVFPMNVTGQSSAAVAQGSEYWLSQLEPATSTLQVNAGSSTSPGATIRKSDNIAQLLTNQVPREDWKYILVGFQLGAANKEEDQSHAGAPSSSSLEVGRREGALEDPSEEELSPLTKKPKQR